MGWNNIRAGDGWTPFRMAPICVVPVLTASCGSKCPTTMIFCNHRPLNAVKLCFLQAEELLLTQVGKTNLKHNLYKHATRNAQIIVAHEETRLNGHAESLSSKDEEGKVEAWECVGMGVNARSLPGVGLPEKSTLPLTPRCHRGLHCHLAHRWQMPLRRLRQK